MKIYVAGPISSVQSNGIQEIADFLKAHDAGEVLIPHEKPIDHLIDWRGKEDEAEALLRENEPFFRDVMDIMVSDLRGPSVGRTIEQMLAIKFGRPVIAYAPNPINSPWPLINTSVVCKTLDQVLEEINKAAKRLP